MADDTNLSNVGSRYAQALFDLATDEQQVASVEADLNSLKKAMAESKELRTLIGSPTFSSDDKAKGLVGLGASAQFNMTTLKFLGLLAANGRAAALPAVIDAYARLSATARGAISAEVTTAVALTDAQAKGVQAALRQCTLQAAAGPAAMHRRARAAARTLKSRPASTPPSSAGSR